MERDTRTQSALDQDIVTRAFAHRSAPAISDEDGVHTYGELLEASARVAGALREAGIHHDPTGRPGASGHGATGPVATGPGAKGAGNDDRSETTVTFLVPPGFAYAATLWGIWRAGAMAVPLALSHPERELAYVLDDARPTVAVAHPDLAPRLEPLAAERNLRLFTTDDLVTTATTADGSRQSDEPLRATPDPEASTHDDPGSSLPPDGAALMLYTSGTTGRPKGVVHTHGSLNAQADTLTTAWGWSSEDRILLVLPLHHLHGLMNVLHCALWNGAECRVLPRFDAARAWEEIGRGTLTLFMAVPTIYHRMIAAWNETDDETRERWSAGGRGLRLMVSGSAALPVSVLEDWERITGHTLLERYGMTEIGMALSNPLRGRRRPGRVGLPLPGVEVRLGAEDDDGAEAMRGEIQVRSPTLFREYWRRPEETRAAFTPDGWFRTGDIAAFDGRSYRILGRRSVDIIKSGGYKISALEVEEVLREHPLVADCGVVGVPDEAWGERVAVAYVGDAKNEEALEPEALRRWALERLAPYKTPTLLRRVHSLPRNAVGKVTKPAITGIFADEG